MDPKHLNIDERLKDDHNICIYCGQKADTREHVPSKVFLDDPLPKFLPTLPACSTCNNSFSLDEMYLACLLECVIKGTTNPTKLSRIKIAHRLKANSSLRAMISNSVKTVDGQLVWYPDQHRVDKIVEKLARGHISYELHNCFDRIGSVVTKPLITMSKEELAFFEDENTFPIAPWPEINSRAFMRLAGKSPDSSIQNGRWIIVQEGRYRYFVEETGEVRIVISDYLACTAYWE